MPILFIHSSRFLCYFSPFLQLVLADEETPAMPVEDIDEEGEESTATEVVTKPRHFVSMRYLDTSLFFSGETEITTTWMAGDTNRYRASL